MPYYKCLKYISALDISLSHTHMHTHTHTHTQTDRQIYIHTHTHTHTYIHTYIHTHTHIHTHIHIHTCIYTLYLCNLFNANGWKIKQVSRSHTQYYNTPPQQKHLPVIIALPLSVLLYINSTLMLSQITPTSKAPL